MNKIDITINITDNESKVTTVNFSSDTGCATTVNGTLYPAGLKVVNTIVQTIRDAKDNYPPNKQPNKP